MRLYLSGPMSSNPVDFNRPVFKAAREQLRALGHWVLDPTELDSLPAATATAGPADQYKWVWIAFLIRDVAMLLSCELDGVVVLPGWRRSKGSRLEVLAAMVAGLRLYRLAVGMLYPERINWIEVADLEPEAKEGLTT